MVFEKLEKRLIIKGAIEALTSIRVGSGAPEIEPMAVDMPIIKDIHGVPYIPGSSLKGKVRSEFERIAKTLNISVCQPPDVRNMCGSKARREEDLCIACKVFGTAGEFARASKVLFRDAYPASEVKATEVRPGVALERERRSVVHGPFTTEAIPKGTKFSLEVVFENPRDEELGLFMAALKSIEELGVGGSLTRGYGKVKINIEEVIERTAKYYVGLESEVIHRGGDLENWIKGREDSLKRWIKEVIKAS